MVDKPIQLQQYQLYLSGIPTISNMVQLAYQPLYTMSLMFDISSMIVIILVCVFQWYK